MTIMNTKRKVIIENEENNSDESEASVMETDPDDVLQSDDSNREQSTAEQVNAGWADSIAKILKTNKPKGKKTLVLSKAKKLSDVRRTITKDVGFEIQDAGGEVSKGQIKTEEILNDTEPPLRKKRKEIQSVRKKPNILEKDRERTLSKIATKGVVQLFNAVKKQQKDIDVKLKEAGPLEVKRDKVLKNIDKREFLNVLMGDKSRIPEKMPPITPTTNVKTKREQETSTWSVLQDDFMMDTKMKDWDKELESESEVEQEIVESE